MLQKIRDKATGWFAYIIIILIAIPFALWGLNEYFGGAGPLVAAEVNGTEIPVRAYQQEFQQQRRQLAEMFGGRIPAGLIDDQQLRDNALQTLIRRELLAQLAQERGYGVSPRLVAEEIRAMEFFHENGQFSGEQYQRVLQNQRLSKAQFEADVRYSLLLLQVEQSLGYAAFLTSADLQEYARLREQTRRVSYHTIAAAQFAQQVQIDEAEIERHYQQHGQRFLRPERLRLAYLMLAPQDLEAHSEVTEEDLRRYYEQHTDRFGSPEERRVRHIVLSAQADDAQAQIQAIRARIVAGESFAELAAALSQDPDSAQRGGDLGFLARGDMDPALDVVSFTLPQGVISQPVQIGNTWQLIEVTEIRAPQREPLEAVRDEIISELRSRQVESRYIELTERLLTESFEQPLSLEPAADATGLEIAYTDWMTAQGGEDELATYPEIRRAAFSAEVLQYQRNSDLIDLPDGRSVVLRVHEHQPSAPRPLAEVQDEIRAQLADEKMSALAQQAADEVLQAIRAGTPVSEAFATVPGDTVYSINMRRDTPDIASTLKQRIFSLPHPETEPQSDVVTLNNGDAVVLVLEQVEDGQVDSAALARYRNQLQNVYANLEAEAVLESLEQRAKIQIYRENL